MYLAPAGGTAALAAAAARVSDPDSPSYRRFLSAAQFHARYDATDAAVGAVSRYLRGSDLSVTSVEAHHRYLEVSGTNAAVQKAFDVSIKRFRHRGRTVQANTSAVRLPSAVAGLVSTVSGLDTTPHLMRPHAAPPSPGFRNARPCSRSYGQVAATKQADRKTPLPRFKGKVLPYAVCGYTGPQLRAAYERNSRLTGRGVTVAITDAYASPTIAADSGRYARAHGDGGYAAGQLKQVVPASFRFKEECDASGWYGEETLDVEAVHAMATDAHIRYYASRSCTDSDFLDTLDKVVDQNKASIVTNSWGDLEQNETTELAAAYEQVFHEGALQGIGFMFSSGDNGDELASTGTKQADYPASDPYVTAVGGTSDAIGAGGKLPVPDRLGHRELHPGPQAAGLGPGRVTSRRRRRHLRPVQAARLPARRRPGRVRHRPCRAGRRDWTPTPRPASWSVRRRPSRTGVFYDEFRIGGTSLASPLMAGMTALLQQHVGGRLGFLNPAIYKKAGSRVFSDVKGAPRDAGNVRADFVNAIDDSDGIIYSVRAFNQDSSLAVRPGWDDVTGVGSPNARWLTSIAP